jgi:wyosine [tRNA(Phe)-imidazoG37] synthetase (radical SAM superfamily)
MAIDPQSFYSPDQVFQEVQDHLALIREKKEKVDYLTFVPDGEPTLDINLGTMIDRLRSLKLPIAVITNASLLWNEEVRAALSRADWVSIKCDSVFEDVWKQINRPHSALKLPDILQGIRAFAKQYRGVLVSETMLIQGINDHEQNLMAVADFLHEIHVSRAYLSVPTRPTSEKDVLAPAESFLNRAYQILAERLPHVEYLMGYEGDAFASTGDVRQDLLSIAAVHPLRESAVKQLLVKADASWSLVEELIRDKELKKVDYLGEHYFVRCLSGRGA